VLKLLQEVARMACHDWGRGWMKCYSAARL
jgi:hypothetical protein